METFTQSQDLRRCALIGALKTFSAKWKPCILSYLLRGDKRFGELLRLISNINKKMLVQHLRELEADGLIHRKVYPEIPPKVEYALTEKGQSLAPVFRSINQWGLENLDEVWSMDEVMSQAQTHYLSNVKPS